MKFWSWHQGTIYYHARHVRHVRPWSLTCPFNYRLDSLLTLNATFFFQDKCFFSNKVSTFLASIAVSKATTKESKMDAFVHTFDLTAVCRPTFYNEYIQSWPRFHLQKEANNCSLLQSWKLQAIFPQIAKFRCMEWDSSTTRAFLFFLKQSTFLPSCISDFSIASLRVSL